MGERGEPGEPGRLRASEVAKRITETPLKPEEQWPERLELRLSSDVPTIEVTPTTSAQQMLDTVAHEPSGTVALKGPDAGVAAVIVPVERYLELARGTIEGECEFDLRTGQMEPDGVIVVPARSPLYVEQTDLNVRWRPSLRQS